MAPRALAACLLASLAGVAGAAGCAQRSSGGAVSRTIGGTAAAVSGLAHVGADPTALAVGSQSVWVTNYGGASLSRLSSVSGRPLGRPLATGPAPNGVAVGGGLVWVTTAPGAVLRFDAATGRRLGQPVRVADPAGIAVGAGGVWVTSPGSGTVVRLESSTGQRTSAIPAGADPTDVAVANGAVWVSDPAAGTVSRIGTHTNRVDRTVRVAHGQVLALAGGDGALWAVKTDSELTSSLALVRLDPRTGSRRGAAVVVPGAIPVRLAAGAGGVWLTDEGNSVPPHPSRPPAVIRVDPARMAIVGAPVRVGAEPAGIAVGSGDVWVSSAASATVARLHPAQ